MTGVANIKKRRNRLKSEMYKPTVRYDFQDGIGDTYDLSDYSKEGPAVIDMTYDDLGYFYLIYSQTHPYQRFDDTIACSGTKPCKQ